MGTIQRQPDVWELIGERSKNGFGMVAKQMVMYDGEASQEAAQCLRAEHAHLVGRRKTGWQLYAARLVSAVRSWPLWYRQKASRYPYPPFNAFCLTITFFVHPIEDAGRSFRMVKP